MSRSNIISRTNVVKGAVDDDYRVAPLPASDAVVLTHSVTLSQEHVRNLSQTPVQVTPVPAPGKRIEVLGAHMHKDAGGYNPGRTLIVLYGSVDGQEAARFPASWMRAPSESGGWGDTGFPLVPPDQVSRPEGVPLIVTSSSGAGGDGAPITITVRYVEAK